MKACPWLSLGGPQSLFWVFSKGAVIIKRNEQSNRILSVCESEGLTGMIATFPDD